MNRFFSHRIEIISVTLFIFLYVLAASSVSLNRYWQHNAFWYDFGIFDNTIWQFSRFKIPIILEKDPPKGKMIWADHLNPSALLLVPIYWVTDKPEVMFITQSVLVGLSAGVGYQIASKRIRSSLARMSLVVSYLGFVGLQNALYTDVHNIVFALLPFMLTLWALYEKKWKWYFLFLCVTVGFQENIAAVALMLGIFLILRRDRNIKIGVLTCLLGLIYGFIAMKMLIPYLNGGGYAYQPDVPSVWYEWITRFIYPADLKIRSIFFTFATFGFLPLGTLSVFPLIIEHYLERFVLNSAATRWDLGFHYNALLSPIMFLASLETLIFLQKKKIFNALIPVWAAVTILTVLFLHRFYLHGPLLLATHPVFYKETGNAKFLDRFIDSIPRGSLLMIQNNIASHFTHQDIVLLNKNYLEIQPDVIALDLRPGQNGNNFFPLRFEDAKELSASLSADLRYEKKEITDTEIIYIRKM